MVSRPAETWLLHWEIESRATGEAVHALFESLKIDGAAIQPCGKPNRASVYLRLNADDSRLAATLDWLRERGIRPRVWRTRMFRTRDRQSADWLWYRSHPSGIAIDCPRQTWDHSAACSTCGAGAVAKEPLCLDEVIMPRGGLTVECIAGQLVATKAVAGALLDAGLSGIVPRQTARKNPRNVRSPLVWLETAFTWPRFQTAHGWRAKALCPDCERAGYFVEFGESPFQPEYLGVPADAPDFGRSFEQWGSWDVFKVGASPLLIISNRAFRVLRELGCRLSFDPVSIGEEVDPFG